jgi:predicted DNA binding CopG/RHH family protein
MSQDIGIGRTFILEVTDQPARSRRDTIRAEYAAEEAEAAEAEAVDAEQAVLSVRISAQLAETLKARAAAEHIPVSTLVRRVLSRGILEHAHPLLTVEQVEQIARRVVLETRTG